MKNQNLLKPENIRVDGKSLPGKVLEYQIQHSEQAMLSHITYSINNRTYMLTCETEAVTFEEDE